MSLKCGLCGKKNDRARALVRRCCECEELRCERCLTYRGMAASPSGVQFWVCPGVCEDARDVREALRGTR